MPHARMLYTSIYRPFFCIMAQVSLGYWRRVSSVVTFIFAPAFWDPVPHTPAGRGHWLSRLASHPHSGNPVPHFISHPHSGNPVPQALPELRPAHGITSHYILGKLCRPKTT